MTYNDSTRPVIQYFESENLVKRLDASKDVDKVSFCPLIRNEDRKFSFLGVSRGSSDLRRSGSEKLIDIFSWFFHELYLNNFLSTTVLISY